MIPISNIPVSNRLLTGIFLTIFSFLVGIGGCHSAGETQSNIQLDWEIEPDPPAVGIATINITLKDSTNTLITGADLELEGNMLHPGMQPVFASAKEVEPGIYAADIEFTMGGDWFFLIQTTLPNHEVFEQQINISGVQTQ